MIFALYPLAPPRFLPEHGFVDTIAANSAGYRDFNASALVNEYAAMPSLHVGWVLLVSIAIMNLVRSRAVRATAAVLPIAMFGAIVLTGNHYIVDGIAGGGGRPVRPGHRWGVATPAPSRWRYYARSGN